MNQRLYEQSSIDTAILKGKHIGRSERRAEDEAVGRTAERSEIQENVVLNGHHKGLTIETLSAITGLTPGQIIEILKRHGLIYFKDS